MCIYYFLADQCKFIRQLLSSPFIWLTKVRDKNLRWCFVSQIIHLKQKRAYRENEIFINHAVLLFSISFYSQKTELLYYNLYIYYLMYYWNIYINIFFK